MAKPYDASTKFLLENYPEAWLRYAGMPVGEASVVNADLSTVSAEADKIILNRTAHPHLAHFELQSSYKTNVPDRVVRYNVMCGYRHELPVRSVVILLRPKADGPAMTGYLERRIEDQTPYLKFEYGVVRVWTRPVEEALRGGLATLALAPISAVKREELPDVIREMERRINGEAGRAEAAQLWTATYVLMGLRYPEPMIEALLQGVISMEDSVTYQAIIRKGVEIGKKAGERAGKKAGERAGLTRGKAEEARHILLRLGTRLLGQPAPSTRAAIEAISSITELEALADRVLDASSWDELLTPQA